MRYAVLGTGMVGRTVAARLLSLGHEVVVGTRDPEVTRARPEFSHGHLPLASFADAAREGETLVNATSGLVSVAALTEAGAADLDGRILIDVANALDSSRGFPPPLGVVNDDSLGELIQRTFPGMRVVKTLNTMNCRIMVEPERVPGDHNVFLSGEDPDAKQSVRALLRSFGWPDPRILDLGGIETARGPEMVLPLWLRLMGTLGHADFNFQIQTAETTG
ncbi:MULTISPECIES: NADPH-dependent F420 reductase [unclassified Streptomyces]|uniref:NADPH-dependent F420 reductase n=1 Tax=unclassified Streptomyces TaxID=2593676 RepID=UPI001BEBDE27|nr:MULTISPECIES: NAD(P)-binding domain-containing protein [unclassified Streptomyces]MBT2402605.1 NAD(P)-binding domain-containing protein [Streptomyces sp. ISL-21]MBT2457205.1 NAD(P)-binding domain-containing protein [Streptomyces sp. ISL-86]MBT2607998.1 NAD(P)-binding domain-containing protein [Streptomyces sp. ISL-87]